MAKKSSMEDFFKAVGFVPPTQGASSGPTAGGEDGGIPGMPNMPKVDFKNPFSKMGVRALVIAIVVLILIIAGAYWWFHPPINLHSGDTWSFIIIFIAAPLFALFYGLYKSYDKGTKKRQRSKGKAKTFKTLLIIPVGLLLVVVIGTIASQSFWPGNAERYANILPTQDSEFSEDIQEVDYSSIPVIDRDSAKLLGNRAMGSIPEYVSQFEISPLYSQINYQSKPVRVSPLNYEDIFKWFSNQANGIPAYVIVDMTTQDTQIVRLDNPIHYSDSEPLEKNIDRYVQLKYPFYMFEQKSFEIDEDGQPWWVCPVQDRTIGLFGGETISRVVLVNASTGECQDYAIEDCPQWVDRAYPSDLLIQQYNWSGAYAGGWLNSWIGQSGVKQTTPGGNGELGYNYIAKDDDVWLYTGVTSATADNSIIGFVLVNQRTADSHFYYVAGATEDSAMASAEGQVQNLGYSATFPLLLNINSQPTYFMALKDNAGTVKKYAMLDIQRYQNVAVGDTVSDCQKSYKALLATNGVVQQGSDEGLATATGTIQNVAQAVIDGNSHFYVTLAGDSRIYDCPLPSMISVVSYGKGDTITLKYVEGDPTCTVQEIEAPGQAQASATTASPTTATSQTAPVSS